MNMLSSQVNHTDKASIALLILFLMVFTAFNLHFLNLPYFWDELGVYGRAALYLHDHNLSLLPGALPPELSRGHPTLFVFIVGSFFSLLGTELWVGHLYPFLLAVLLVVAVFWAGRKFFHPYVGLGAAILLMAQPVFFAQAGLILPEMQLALLSFAGLHFYLNRLWVPYIIITALAVLTKETAVILPFILTGCEVIFHIREHQKVRIGSLLKRSLIILSPIMAFGLFLIVQKMQHGWFFFPYHVSFIKIDVASIKYKLTFFSNFIFLHQGRWVWLLIAAIGTVLFFWRNKQRIKHYFKQLFSNDVIVSYLLTVFILFVSFLVSPDMHRYTLILYPFLVICLSAIIWRIVPNQYTFLGVTLVVAIIHIIHQEDNEFVYDTDADYINAVKVQKKATLFFDKQADEDTTLQLHANFPFFYGLKDRRLGYLDKNKSLPWHGPLSGNTDFIVKQSPGTPVDANLQDTSKYILHKVFERGFAEVKIYKVKDTLTDSDLQ